MPNDVDIVCGAESAAAEITVMEKDDTARLAELEEECARLRQQYEALQKKKSAGKSLL